MGTIAGAIGAHEQVLWYFPQEPWYRIKHPMDSSMGRSIKPHGTSGMSCAISHGGLHGISRRTDKTPRNPIGQHAESHAVHGKGDRIPHGIQFVPWHIPWDGIRNASRSPMASHGLPWDHIFPIGHPMGFHGMPRGASHGTSLGLTNLHYWPERNDWSTIKKKFLESSTPATNMPPILWF